MHSASGPARLFGVRAAEICSRSLRPHVLDARAAVGHLAVCHYGLPLTAVARATSMFPVRASRAVWRVLRTHLLAVAAPPPISSATEPAPLPSARLRPRVELGDSAESAIRPPGAFIAGVVKPCRVRFEPF